ncbi:LacI family DNA-binding transcriptional regulator [Thermoactinospora rubra]|uniref:LacI family DNA-binding transcriptional regulator n=1 Tax=Thermoactinospora rubra TaxID=1088767 RepID=UPI000A0F6D49|nr:LacI family DNA-binding transcriptional regulator [Thermoactinospora rubra]
MTDLPPPTLAHVAAAAGVSPATVSRVLTGSARVTTSTRRQVHEALTRLGYTRQRAPHGQRRDGTLVAAVVCEQPQRLFTEPFYARLLPAAEAALAAEGVPLAIMSAATRQSLLTGPALITGRMTGVLLVGAPDGHPVAAMLSASGLPVRCVGRPPDGLALPYVDMDNRDGGRQAAERLLLTDRRSIAAIAGPAALPGSRDRIEGFLQTLAQAGITDVPVAYGDFSHRSGAQAMHGLLRRRPMLDAVFAVSDAMAVAAQHVLHRAGRRVPDDVAVIGFDDSPLALHASPRLTSVRQPVEELGARAARLLLHQTPDNPVLPTELVVRESG